MASLTNSRPQCPHLFARFSDSPKRQRVRARWSSLSVPAMRILSLSPDFARHAQVVVPHDALHVGLAVAHLEKALGDNRESARARLADRSRLAASRAGICPGSSARIPRVPRRQTRSPGRGRRAAGQSVGLRSRYGATASRCCCHRRPSAIAQEHANSVDVDYTAASGAGLHQIIGNVARMRDRRRRDWSGKKLPGCGAYSIASRAVR